MKTGLVLLAFLFSTHAFADGPKITKVTATCNLSDLSLQDNPNIETRKLDLELNKTIEFTSYKGHTYSVSAFEMSAGDNVRYEIVVASRDSETKAVIGSAIAAFFQEIPDVLYQEGPDVLLNCMQFKQ